MHLLMFYLMTTTADARSVFFLSCLRRTPVHVSLGRATGFPGLLVILMVSSAQLPEKRIEDKPPVSKPQARSFVRDIPYFLGRIIYLSNYVFEEVASPTVMVRYQHYPVI